MLSDLCLVEGTQIYISHCIFKIFGFSLCQEKNIQTSHRNFQSRKPSLETKTASTGPFNRSRVYSLLLQSFRKQYFEQIMRILITRHQVYLHSIRHRRSNGMFWGRTTLAAPLNILTKSRIKLMKIIQ